MVELSTRGSERKTDRAEAFSDAVLAIAITLPVVDLKAPEYDPARRLAAQYAELWPQYAAYAMSFAVIGVYWGYSHFSGKLLRKTDHGFNLLTLLFLGCVSVTPFPARALAQHWSAPDADARVAALVYACLLTAPALTWAMRWIYGVRRGLLNPHLAPDYLARATRKYVAMAGACVLGCLITAFGSWKLGLVLVGATTALFVLPPMAPRFKPGEDPADDLEEADEERGPAVAT